MTQTKITTGTNDRPRDASIAQSAGGLPDDSGQPVTIDERQAARLKEKLVGTEADESEAHPS